MRSAATSFTLACHSCCKYRFRMQFINPALPAPHLVLRQRVDPRSEVRRLVAYRTLSCEGPARRISILDGKPTASMRVPSIEVSAPVEALLALRQGTPAQIIAVEVTHRSLRSLWKCSAWNSADRTPGCDAGASVSDGVAPRAKENAAEQWPRLANPCRTLLSWGNRSFCRGPAYLGTPAAQCAAVCVGEARSSQVIAPSFHSALVSTQNRQHSRADPPSPHTGVGRKGRLLPTRRPFNFPRGQLSSASAEGGLPFPSWLLPSGQRFALWSQAPRPMRRKCPERLFRGLEMMRQPSVRARTPGSWRPAAAYWSQSLTPCRCRTTQRRARPWGGQAIGRQFCHASPWAGCSEAKARSPRPQLWQVLITP